MLSPPAEGNLCDEYGRALKSAMVQDYNRHMGMRTNLTAWQTLTLLADGPGSGQRSYSTLWTLPFSTVLTFSSLVVQNYHANYSTAIGEGPNTRGGKGALNSDHKTRMISPILQLKTLDTWHNKHWRWKGREFIATCILLKTKKQERNSSVQNATWVCVVLCVLRYITPNSISEHQLTRNWSTSVDFATVITKPIFFTSVFLIK
jgi:hypothetical protein